MKFLLTFSLIFCVKITTIYAQEHLIVFNKDGRIIKNDGFDRGYNAIQARFMIEGVVPEEADNYFVLYQVRNDFLYTSNNTLENHAIEGFIYQPGFFAEISNNISLNPRFENMELVSYYLIKVDDSLANWIGQNNSDTLNTATLLRAAALTFYNQFTGIDMAALQDSMNKLESAIDDLTVLQIKKKEQNYNESFEDLLIEKKWLQKQLELMEKQRASLPDQKEGCCTIETFNQLSNKINELNEELFEKDRQIIETIREHDKRIKKAENKVEEMKKTLVKALDGITLPSIEVLHQGTLVAKDRNTHEIAYNIFSKTINKSDKRHSLVGRWTADLPRLNTESLLYLHLFNIQPDLIESDPFTFQFSSSVSEEVSIESPSNFQGLQDADIGFDFSGLAGSFPKEAGFIVPDQQVPDEDPKATEERSELFKKLFGQVKNVNMKANYLDYVLKYPKEFKAKREVTIEIKRKQYASEEFVQKVEEGTLKKEGYLIKYKDETLSSDVLPPVHRLYRFALTTGLVFTRQVDYSYKTAPIGSTSQMQLVEYKNVQNSVRPLLTFSTYVIRKQDTAMNPESILNTLHFDIGMDYAQTDIFDDIYVGVGLEPWRSIHLVMGAAVSRVQRVDANRLDPVTLNVSDALVNQTKIGYYVGINLGINLIPNVIKTFKK